MNYQDGKREVGEEAGKKWQKYNFSFVLKLRRVLNIIFNRK